MSKKGIFAGILAAALILPHLLPVYYLQLMDLFLIGALFALSFNLLYGSMGLLSFGHAAFFGVGAYSVALLMKKAGIHYFLCLPLSLIITGLMALIIGYFCARVSEWFFAILTLAFGQLLFVVVSKWYSLTSGDDGIQSVFPPPIIGTHISYYYFTLIMVTIGAALLWRIVHSPFGYTLCCLRDNRQKSESIGINVKRYQWMGFVVAGIFAGFAGGLFVTFNWAVAPTELEWTKSAEPVVMTLLGGQFTFFGPVVGSAIFTFLQFVVGKKTIYWALIMGIVLLVVVRFLPGGVCGFLEQRWQAGGRNKNTGSAF
ncbi:MAG: branched-chain amino acid ABC transporter permease [Deltaproteobacteria bacterium]|nr:branched-chain amino acid ABC transporter permease [Deltaproteobacteria bacterium]